MVQHSAILPITSVEERELLRQRHITRLLLEEMGGSLPHDQILAEPLKTVLDVACGAGSWALDVAETCPSIQVTGIESSNACLTFVQRLADERGLVNAHFLLKDMHTLDAGPFDLNSFDLINVAFIAPTLLTTDYAALMRSLFHLCRPGGIIRWTEMELPLTNSLAFEQLMALVCRALEAAGQTFIPPDMQRSAAIFEEWRRALGLTVLPFERRHLGITPMMSGWLREAGCREVALFPVSVEVSSGTRVHTAFVQQMEVFGQQMAPFLIAQCVTTAEALVCLLARVRDELQQDDFCGLCLLLTLYGYKA